MHDCAVCELCRNFSHTLQCVLIFSNKISINFSWPHGTISERVKELTIEILWKLFCRSFYFNNSIRSQFCTCHDSSVTILHMSRQLSCRDMCKVVTVSGHYFLSKRSMDYDKLWITSSWVICEISPHTHSGCCRPRPAVVPARCMHAGTASFASGRITPSGNETSPEYKLKFHDFTSPSHCKNLSDNRHLPWKDVPKVSFLRKRNMS